MIAELAQVLADAGLDLNVDELRDALWLAEHLPTEPAPARAGGDLPAPVPPRSDAAGTLDADDLIVESPMATTHNPELPASTIWSGPRTSVFVRGPDARGTAMAGVPVRIAAVPALRHQLELSRALKPLGRRVDSDRLFEVDEDATADRIAEEGLWVPVLRPQRERWLSVALVVDSAPSMAVWRRTVDEFAGLLGRQGCFTDVRRYRLDSAQEGRPADPLGAATYAHRGVVIVITDGVSVGWRNGESQRLLRHWARTAPVSIMTVLPQRMWRGTGLRMRPKEFRVPRPAIPNAQWQVADSQDVRIPVFEIAPDWIRQWSTLTTASAARHRAALLATQDVGTTEHTDARSDQAADPATLVEIFRMTASPTAFHLVCYLSATTLVLPVMRMVQHVMLPESHLAHLAEVILGGLLVRWEPGPDTDPEQVEYDFLPGVRNVLADQLTRTEIVDLLRASSEFVAGTIGSPFDLEAMLSDPDSVDLQTVTHTEGAEPIAWVAASLLARMDGKYRVLADKLMGRNPLDPAPPKPVSELAGFDDRMAVAVALADAREFNRANDLLEVLLADCNESLEPDHPSTLRTRTKLVEYALDARDVLRAKKHIALLARECLRVFGTDNEIAVAAQHSEARFTGHSGNPSSAIEQLSELMPVSERVLGPDHLETLNIRHNIAYWTGETGNHTAAMELFQALLPDRTRVLGPDDTETLITRSQLAYRTGETGNHTAAIELYQSVLLDSTRVLGADHPDTLTIRHNIAYWTSKTGNHTAAMKLFQALLPDRTRALGPDDTETLITRSQLAYQNGETGNHTAAIELYQSVLLGRTRVLGAHHPDTLTTRHNIAYWTGRAGNHNAAVAAFQALLSDSTRALGPDHPDTLSVRSNIAYWTGKTGDHTTALDLYEALLPDNTRALGTDHPDTLNTRSNIAWEARKSGDAQRATAMYRSMLADCIRVLGPTHDRIRHIRSYLAYSTAQSADPTTDSTSSTSLSEDPGIVVWLELLATAHLVGRPSPNPDRPWLTGLRDRYSLEELADAVELRLRVSVEAQDQWTDVETQPEALIAHLVDRAMSFLDYRSPVVCDGNETEWHTPEYLEYTDVFARSIRALYQHADPSEQFLGATEWLNLTTTWPTIAYGLTDMA
ncbi:SAV_2336 N-terminal domain-related protein [Nocardia sp. NPDC058518]|uniref:SAV_2336 N-terminal domain-related protein n=1 Tax=Nocardia sp. NPDC058518 TaxID=3346534 RepID=UPI003660509D